jgi:hypothetical protein
LDWCSSTFFAIATDARAYDIFPGGFPTLGSRDDVVEAQLAHGSGLAAVLATVGISGKEGFAIESDGGFWNAIVEDQPNDPGDLQFPRRCFDVILSGLFVQGLQIRQFTPVVEIVVDVLVIFDGDHFGAVAIQEGHRAAHIDYTNSHVEPVQDQNAAIE